MVWTSGFADSGYPIVCGAVVDAEMAIVAASVFGALTFVFPKCARLRWVYARSAIDAADAGCKCRVAVRASPAVRLRYGCRTSAAVV